MAKRSIAEPKWLTSEIKRFFDYEVSALPKGLRLTKLTLRKRT